MGANQDGGRPHHRPPFPTLQGAGAEPRPVLSASPARRLRDALEPLGAHAYWNPLTAARLAEAGLDRFDGYVWGRAAALGDVPAALAASAFAWFEPERLARAYESGRRRLSRAGVIALRTDTTSESLGSILAGADLEPAVAVLRRGLAAASGSGRPLFAALSSEPWPESTAGRLWRACDLLREHRGDGHIAAAVSAGLDPAEMNVLTELWLEMLPGSYSATRHWSRERLDAALLSLERRGLAAGGRLTARGRRLRDRLEQATDASQEAVIRALGEDLEPTVASLRRWSDLVIAAGAFSRDPRKRAAG